MQKILETIVTESKLSIDTKLKIIPTFLKKAKENGDDKAFDKFGELERDTIISSLNKICRDNKLKFWKMSNILLRYNQMGNQVKVERRIYKELHCDIKNKLQQYFDKIYEYLKGKEYFICAKFKEGDENDESTIYFSFEQKKTMEWNLEDQIYTNIKNKENSDKYFMLYIENKFLQSKLSGDKDMEKRKVLISKLKELAQCLHDSE